ncbi:hypothetical protein CN152_33560 [Sinorhizobium meliloti]|nr:hypothetical protein CN152_33560 [Sinorhizobium meliloti]RVN35552.1 hypothetical protein CN113_33785 [Sinorhizobium meliloti]
MIRQLADIYRGYLDCLNRQAWDELGHFVDNEIQHNGRLLERDAFRRNRKGDSFFCANQIHHSGR